MRACPCPSAPASPFAPCTPLTPLPSLCLLSLTRQVILLSEENAEHRVSKKVAQQSTLVATMTADDSGACPAHSSARARARPLCCCAARRLASALCVRPRSHSHTPPLHALPSLSLLYPTEDNSRVPLTTIKSSVLGKVIEFMNHHVDKKLPEIEKRACPEAGGGLRAAAAARQCPGRAPTLTPSPHSPNLPPPCSPQVSQPVRAHPCAGPLGH